MRTRAVLCVGTRLSILYEKIPSKVHTCENIRRLGCKENHITAAKLVYIATGSEVDLHTR